MANSADSSQIWSALDKLGRYSRAWLEALAAMPSQTLSLLFPEEISASERKFIAGLISFWRQKAASGWQAHIDGLTPQAAWGWLKQDAKPACVCASLYIGNEPAYTGFLACNHREDVKRAGFGNGDYGFYLDLSWLGLAPDQPFLAVLTEPLAGQPLALRFYEPAR